MKVSKNFSLKELTRTDCRMDNTPDSRALMNIAVLAARILQPVRDEFGPGRVSSCFRCKEVNAAIGGSETSDHVAGDGTTTGTAAAADFEVISEEISNLQLGEWIRDNLEFKQLILEYYDPENGGPNSGWIHCSYDLAGNNKMDVRTKKKGVSKYLEGFVLD